MGRHQQGCVHAVDEYGDKESNRKPTQPCPPCAPVGRYQGSFTATYGNRSRCSRALSCPESSCSQALSVLLRC